jgi:hypothetical protein
LPAGDQRGLLQQFSDPPEENSYVQGHGHCQAVGMAAAQLFLKPPNKQKYQHCEQKKVDQFIGAEEIKEGRDLWDECAGNAGQHKDHDNPEDSREVITEKLLHKTDFPGKPVLSPDLGGIICCREQLRDLIRVADLYPDYPACLIRILVEYFRL